MKLFKAPDGLLEEFRISSNRMPEWERRVFTTTGARLFLGTVDGVTFGCVRMLETGKTEEGGRKCYNNIAFEGTSEEAVLVRALLYYARYHYRDFERNINQMIQYEGVDYYIDYGVFARLCEKCKAFLAESKSPGIGGFLVPEISADNFFSQVKVPFGRGDVDTVIAFDEMTKEEFLLKLFFYCSAPSTGFVLKQIDYETGDVIRDRKEAADAMPPYAFSIMSRGGASMALYQVQDEVCFVAKGVCSEDVDHHGRRTITSLVFSARNEQKQQLCQLAAWALLDYKAFSAALTDCLKVSETRYDVEIGKLKELLGWFAKKIYIHLPKHDMVWQTILKMQPKKKFQYLVLDTTLDYFVRNAEIEVTPSQVVLLMGKEKFDAWNRKPLKLELSERLYQAPDVNTAEVCQKQDLKAESINFQQEPKKLTEPMSLESEGECGDDAINLLEQKWFKMFLIIGGAVIVGVIAFWIKRLLGK